MMRDDITFGYCDDMQKAWENCFYKEFNVSRDASKAAKSADIAFESMYGVNHLSWVRWFLGSRRQVDPSKFDAQTDYAARIPEHSSQSETPHGDTGAQPESQK